ncbi:lysyl oxidase family protein [Nocardioides caeni]|uniref:lysyl oxidase family protein n=1 Tax=Nocardioides caeni TaxID=574700 RepID=UPI00130518B9|nr:lysyl oxidase family protein [Nocardioides caeni]
MKFRLPAAMLTAAVLTLTTLAPQQASAEPTGPPLQLTGAPTVTTWSWDGYVGSLGLNLVAPDTAFEVHSTRANWKSPIVATWQSPSGPVALPEIAGSSWGGLGKFVRVTAKRADGTIAADRRMDICLNSWNTQRTSPDAPLRSPYPTGCPYHPYTKGSVQGIQEDWLASVEMWDRPFRLRPGTYTITASITSAYLRALGMSATEGRHTYTLVVKDGEESEEHHGRAARARVAQPTATEPRAARAGAPGDDLADLQSLPAYGMTLSPNGKVLRFSATVWNAGNSPMIVDGFRGSNDDEMDAYQVFTDADGNQTGYEKVGTMIWHDAESHHHWHFEDFARYSLLNADKTEAVRSRKESFCLANTDAVDYTVPGADWQPDNTDLHTSCGDEGSISLRQVLSPGSGDTYAQFRAGQAFRVDNLPNGIYYVAVQANPDGNLIETSTTNNVAMRRIRLSGTPTNRKLSVTRLGVIAEPPAEEY